MSSSVRFSDSSEIIRTIAVAGEGKELARDLLAGGRMSSEVTRLLDQITDTLIRRLIGFNPEIREGIVRTVGPPPYRRLDCRNRALLYIRTRPKKRLVRVDITGLWAAPVRCRLSLPSASGVSLALRSELDVDEAIRFILQTVARTGCLQ